MGKSIKELIQDIKAEKEKLEEVVYNKKTKWPFPKDTKFKCFFNGMDAVIELLEKEANN